MLCYRVPLCKTYQNDKRQEKTSEGFWLGVCVYLGPLICNFSFFFRKNNFEGTFLTDELAQMNFE